MSGYQNNPEATAEVIDKDGFFDTGAMLLDGVCCVLFPYLARSSSACGFVVDVSLPTFTP